MFKGKMIWASLAILLVAMPLLTNCAWREGAPCDDVMLKDGGADAAKAAAYDDSDLRGKIADLERRLAANESLADSAMMTAQKALDCCRKEHEILFTENIYFAFNRADLRQQSREVLDRVAERLKADPDLIAEFSGYADAVGNAEYNIVLGQRRAEAARDYVVNTHKINSSRLAVRSFGNSSAVHPATAPEDVREADRRVTIDILGYSK